MEHGCLPSLRRIRAFAIAPAVGVAVFLLMEPFRGYPNAPINLRVNLEILSMAYVFVAVPLTLVFGCPTYMLLKGRVRATIWRCMLIGAAIGSLPIMTMMLSSRHIQPDTAVVLTQTGATVSEMAATALGAIELAIAGAAGGVCFWFSAGRDFRQRRPRS